MAGTMMIQREGGEREGGRREMEVKGVRNQLTVMTSFSDSDNGSSTCFRDAVPAPADSPTAYLEALHLLFNNLSSIFQSSDFEFCINARISIAGSPLCEIDAHRCVLSARSPFFYEVFAK